MQELERTVMLAIRLRAGVERDRVRREIEAVYDPEGPARLALSLERLRAGLLVIGLDRRTAMQVVTKVAMDSTPRFRLQAYNALTDDWQTTKAIALALELPATTTQRALEDLVAQGLAAREEKEAGANRWRRVTDPTSEPEDFYPQNTSHGVNDGLSSSLIRKKKTEEDFAGNSSPSLFETTDLKAAPEDHRCVQCRGQVDGSERPYTTRDGRTVWLHPTCKRFFHS
jgi:hypothetical protein